MLQKLRATGEVLFATQALKLLGRAVVAVQMNLEEFLVAKVNATEMAEEVPWVPSPRLVRFPELTGPPWGCNGKGICVLRSLRTFLQKIFKC